MSLSDCERCWNTPCTCGYAYRDWSWEHILRMWLGTLMYKMNAQKGRFDMPMNFPDMESLKRYAEIIKFREPHENESESAYRFALAKFVEPRDFIESFEIRFRKGWDQWTDAENMIVLAEQLRKTSWGMER